MTLEQENARLRAAVEELGKCPRCRGAKKILATRGVHMLIECSACGGHGLHPIAVAALGRDGVE